MSGPSREVVVAHLSQRFESPLNVKAVGPGVVAVHMTKKPFEFADLFVANVVPDCKERKVSPEVAFLAPV